MPVVRRPRPALLAGTSALAVAAAVGLLPGSSAPAQAAGLVRYGGCAELVDAVRDRLERARSSAQRGSWRSGVAVSAQVEDSAAGGQPAGGSSGSAAAAAGREQLDTAVGRGTTGTTLQEQDVDEPDRAKLRDEHLVLLSPTRLVVVTAAAQPRVVSSLSLSDGRGEDAPYAGSAELLLSGDRALVVLSAPEGGPGPVPLPEPAVTGASSGLVVEPALRPRTRLLLVDLADPARPRLLEQATYDGEPVSARLVDGTVRLVTATHPAMDRAWPLLPSRAAGRAADRAEQASLDRLDADDVLPQVERRDAAGRVLEHGRALPCDAVHHPADDAATGPAASPHLDAASAAPTTLLVTTFRPETGLAATHRTALTPAGDTVYASRDRLYVASTGAARGRAAAVATRVHAFDTTAPRTTRYVASGTVDGALLSRWALSEHEGALRVATTREGRAGRTSSSVWVLAERGDRLVERGRIDGLGVGERIQAVRFFGDLAAVVTFRQTDPLYLLDLADPAAPRVLGELKVPGFSQYLHPLGDGLLLGVGQDADRAGRVTGLLVQVFDVRDLRRPRQVSRLRLGPGWTPVEHDSRAFGYDPARRLVTLPVVQVGAAQDADGASTGTPTGTPAGPSAALAAPGSTGGWSASALGITVGPDGALRVLGRLRLPEGEPVERVLADAERVYAVSPERVVAGEAATLRRTGVVALPG